MGLGDGERGERSEDRMRRETKCSGVIYIAVKSGGGVFAEWVIYLYVYIRFLFRRVIEVLNILILYRVYYRV